MSCRTRTLFPAQAATEGGLAGGVPGAAVGGLTEGQADEEFSTQLESSIEEIYQASVRTQPIGDGNHRPF